MPATTNTLAVEGPNYVLNLGIPAGATGPIPTITATATVVEGDTADVQVTEQDNGYQFAFTLPQASGLNAYGSKYNTQNQAYTLVANTPTVVDLGATGPTNNVDTDTANTITITEDGVYEVTYNVALTATDANPLTVAVRNGTTALDGGSQTFTTQANDNIVYGGSTIVNLTSGNTITIALTSTNTPGGTINQASLIVKKLD